MQRRRPASQASTRARSPAGASSPPRVGISDRFTSVRVGPSDHENLVNHLTLQFLETWRGEAVRESQSLKAKARVLSKNRPRGGVASEAAEADALAASSINPSPLTLQAPHATAAALRRVQMLRFLRTTTQREVQVLDLRNADLTPEDFVSVSVVLSNHPTVSTVDLRNNRCISDFILELMLKVARTNRFITDVFVDDHHLVLPSMPALLQALEENRSFVETERKRRWIAAEAEVYERGVSDFVGLVETFFVAEMRQRGEIEDLEWARRKELVGTRLSHRKVALRRQHARRTMELVLERLELVVDQEGQFRREVRNAWLKGVQRLSVELETSARLAQHAEEVRERAVLKGIETKSWVVARRHEKTRKEFEAAQRWQVEVAERKERAVREEECAAARLLVVQWGDRDRDQAIAAESVRLEKERREAIQRRKEAEALREKKEREEKEAAMALHRLKIEQRKERERFDTEATVARKRIINESFVFFRAVEERWSVELPVVTALTELLRNYDMFLSVVRQDIPLILLTRTQKPLLPLLEKDLTEATSTSDASNPPGSPQRERLRPVVPHATIRLEQPNGWPNDVSSRLEMVQKSFTHFRDVCARPWQRAAGSGAAAAEEEGEAPDQGASVSRRKSMFGGGTTSGDEALHPVQQVVLQGSLERLEAYESRPEVTMTLLKCIKSVDDVLLWRNNVLRAEINVSIATEAGAAAMPVELEVVVDASLMEVSGGVAGSLQLRRSEIDDVAPAALLGSEDVNPPPDGGSPPSTLTTYRITCGTEPHQRVRIVSKRDAKWIPDILQRLSDGTLSGASAAQSRNGLTTSRSFVLSRSLSTFGQAGVVANVSDGNTPPEEHTVQRTPDGAESTVEPLLPLTSDSGNRSPNTPVPESTPPSFHLAMANEPGGVDGGRKGSVTPSRPINPLPHSVVGTADGSPLQPATSADTEAWLSLTAVVQLLRSFHARLVRNGPSTKGAKAATVRRGTLMIPGANMPWLKIEIRMLLGDANVSSANFEVEATAAVS